MAKDKAKKQTKNEKQSENEDMKSKQSQVHQNDGGSKIWQDERFQHLVADPRFKSLPKAQRKVQIDKRFQSMFTDDKFKIKYTVDKYGRRVNTSNAEHLKKFYELDSDAENEDEEVVQLENDTEPRKVISKTKKLERKRADSESASDSGDDEDEDEERRKEEKAIIRDAEDKSDSEDLGESDEETAPFSLREELLNPNIDYARGEGRMVTDSSTGEESSEDDDDSESIVEHTWGELDAEAERTDDSTRRLAICNMDWDRIRAVDLMVLLNSFLPPGGSILSVKIYPSEFGKKRLVEEEKSGPPELVGLGKEMWSKNSAKTKARSEDESEDDEQEMVNEQDSDAEEGDAYHTEKLRQYQLNRLRYYYGVVECDSVATADKLYVECDGLEYESSATRMDLRFIPDDTSFDDDEPSDTCTDMPDSSSYKPRQFTTTALQQAKVDLTWDETSVERRELTDLLSSGKMENVKITEIKKLVAFSSDEENDKDDDNEEGSTSDIDAGDEAEMSKERSSIENRDSSTKKKNKGRDYISKYKALLAEINEKEKQKKNNTFEMEVTWNINEDPANNDDNTDPEEKPKVQLTPIERALQKRNEKNKKRKEERKKKKQTAAGFDPDHDSSDHSDSIPDGIDMNDPYFAEEFADPGFESSKKTKKQNEKKNKKTRNHNNEGEDSEEEERKARELQLLLDSDDDGQEKKQHFSLDKILKAEQETKSKRKRRKQLKKPKSLIAQESNEAEDNFQININDERFKAIYSSPNFNIDPTDPHFKKTKVMEKILHEKLERRFGDKAFSSDNGGNRHETLKRLAENSLNVEIVEKRPKKQVEQSLLIKSIKRKIQMNNT